MYRQVEIENKTGKEDGNRYTGTNVTVAHKRGLAQHEGVNLNRTWNDQKPLSGVVRLSNEIIVDDGVSGLVLDGMKVFEAMKTFQSIALEPAKGTMLAPVGHEVVSGSAIGSHTLFKNLWHMLDLCMKASTMYNV